MEALEDDDDEMTGPQLRIIERNYVLPNYEMEAFAIEANFCDRLWLEYAYIYELNGGTFAWVWRDTGSCLDMDPLAPAPDGFDYVEDALDALLAEMRETIAQ